MLIELKVMYLNQHTSRFADTWEVAFVDVRNTLRYTPQADVARLKLHCSRLGSKNPLQMSITIIAWFRRFRIYGIPVVAFDGAHGHVWKAYHHKLISF